MYRLNVLSAGLLLLITMLYSATLLAEQVDFDGQKFIETASIRSISEIETAKIALEKSSSPAVQAYARHMITEASATLNALHTLANDSHLTMLSDLELQAKARKYVFERQGQTFDTAYAGMRAAERRKMVNLYRQAINSDNAPIKRYAETALPELMHDLYMAQQLSEQLGSTSVLLASKL